MSETITSKLKLSPFSKVRRLGSLDSGYEGTYRILYKTQAGYIKSTDITTKSPYSAFSKFLGKAIQSIELIKEMDGGRPYAFTVYARSGRKVWADDKFLSEVTVGDINQDLSKTDLYCQDQYKHVNAKTWSDKAFVQNS